MKARKKGDIKPFEDVYKIVIGRGLNAEYIPINEVEFEQECKNSNHSEDHWQDVRERAAIAAMQSFLSFGNTYKYITPEGCADNALRYADALVKKLKGE